ncbi:MAG: hypothetical protein ABI778_01895 [Ignavibacteriota bacterium]
MSIFFLFDIIQQNSTYAQEPSPGCAVYCEGAVVGSYYENITLPGYPDCTITFLVGWYRCPDGTVTLTFPKVYWQFPSGACSTFMARLYNGGTTPDWDFVSWIFDEGYHIISQKAFDQLYAAALPWDKYQYECPNHGPATYRGAYESCVDYVYFDDPIHQITRVEKQPCSDQVCCLLQTTYCYDTATHTDVETDTWVQQPSPAPDCSSDIVGLPSGALFHSGCKVLCGAMIH